MVSRCYVPTTHGYERYGGAGITVCAEWRHSFEAFIADMGQPPSELHTVDRENGRLGYFKKNCRWATRFQQQNNLRSNVRYTHDGQTLTLPEWSRRQGIGVSTLAQRLRSGWEVGRALTTQPSVRSRLTGTTP
jgi:hypothetical protein